MDKWEQRAKYWDDKLPNLANALRSKETQYACDDIEKYGWILCTSDCPKDDELVLVTDGKSVWMGDYNGKRSVSDGKWSVVYDGAPPFDSTEVIAWIFMPHIPPDLLNSEPNDERSVANPMPIEQEARPQRNGGSEK